jgi:response regulator of citrate/malate metabolism
LPSSTLYRKLQQVLSEVVVEPIPEQRRPGPREIPSGIPENEWHIVLARVAHHESYRTIAKDYQVSRETIRRFVQAATQAS